MATENGGLKLVKAYAAFTKENAKQRIPEGVLDVQLLLELQRELPSCSEMTSNLS